jgi:hypothetical protein
VSLLQAACFIIVPIILYYGAKAGTQSLIIKQVKDDLKIIEKDREWYKEEYKKLQKNVGKISMELIVLRNFKFRFHEMIRVTRSKKKDEHQT